ncbi:MAG: cell division protein FtsL [Methylococcaceae bacterium]|nr:cell division protein FtsL [Methylococcaceae bacterium]
MRLLVSLLMVMVLSALAVVYTKYRSRMLFAEIQRLEQELDLYELEWGQLQLEQNTWAEHSRIERLARTRLGMILPDRNAIIYLKP